MNLTNTLKLSLLVLFASGIVSAATPCADLAKLSLPNAKVTLAREVAPGAFEPPSNTQGKAKGPDPIFKKLPAFCRVALTLTPSSDSEILMELWLPSSGWNGRFQAIGNGGWAGNIGLQNLGAGVEEGYATAGSNTGHTTNNSEFTFGHPEKLIDFAYRAVHEMTVQSKAVIKAFYGQAPRYSYWNACSTGGRQGMSAAQRFPEDFDGIIAGAPANPFTRLHAGSIYNTTMANKEPGSLIPAEKYAPIHKKVVEACDALDGLKDGLIGDPTKCKFDPKELLCKNGDANDCLTAPQVESLSKAYSGAVNPRTKEQIFPGWERGFELGLRVTSGPQPEANAIDTFRAVLQNPTWDWKTLDFDQDIAETDKRGNQTVNAADPAKVAKDFLGTRKGKLLMFHGWADPNIAPRNTVNYYNKVVAAAGGAAKASNSIRLFMFPGMGHCGGGEGPNAWDKMKVITEWVENGKAPDSFVASHSTGGAVDRTRPICAYPRVARYNGTGSIDDAANFTCKAAQ